MIDDRLAAPVDDEALTGLHRAAFGDAGDSPGQVIPWSDRLARHSLTWVTAYRERTLVGFVNVIGDGGAHAVLLDIVVSPAQQSRGIGRELVARVAQAARAQGCSWLHVDYEPALADFYERVCGVRPTAAGLLPLSGPASPPPHPLPSTSPGSS